MLPDLNRLKVFYHVYARQSINLAAQDLFLTQPGISRHIQILESEIGTPLFTRLHKRIVPTRAGVQLFAKVQPFIESLASEIRNISTPTDRPFGNLRMGPPLEFGKTYLPGICIRLGMGLGITFNHLILPYVEQKSIIPLFPGKERVANHISLVQLKNKKPPLTEKVFLDFLRKGIRDTAREWGDEAM